MVKENIAIVGESLSEECVSALEDMGYSVIVLPKDQRLGDSVATHTDLSVFPLAHTLFCYNGAVKDLLDAHGLSTFAVSEEPKSEYPYDIYLNALTVGKYIFARKKYLSSSVLNEAERLGYTVIDVKQGYARCTACPIDENAIITADPSILKAAAAVGIEVLEVSLGGVTLKGYPYGFIGGACGVHGDKMFFAGDIYTHTDGERIVEFCRARGKRVISLCSGALCDVGSIFFI